MNSAAKTDINQFDNVFRDISKLYDYAEDILKVAYHESVEDHDEFVSEIEGLVAQIEESANIIAEDYSNIIEAGTQPDDEVRKRIDEALRKIRICVDEYKQRVKNAINK